MMPRVHRRNLSSRFGQSAFTLIELLVVISIISLLIAILLPTLSASRSAARDTQCKSQMRQIALANDFYLDAFRSSMTSPRMQFSPFGDIYWPEAYYRLGYFNEAFAAPTADDLKYINCPSQAARTANTARGYGQRTWANSATTTQSTNQYIRVHRVRSPSNFGTFFDTVREQFRDGTYRITYGTTSGSREAIAPRHRGLFNVSFLDGSVRGNTPPDFQILETNITGQYTNQANQIGHGYANINYYSTLFTSD